MADNCLPLAIVGLVPTATPPNSSRYLHNPVPPEAECQGPPRASRRTRGFPSGAKLKFNFVRPCRALETSPIFLQLSKYVHGSQPQKPRAGHAIRRYVLRHGDRASPADHAIAAVGASRMTRRRRNLGRARHSQFHTVTPLDKLRNEGLVDVRRESTLLRYTASTKALQELVQLRGQSGASSSMRSAGSIT